MLGPLPVSTPAPPVIEAHVVAVRARAEGDNISYWEFDQDITSLPALEPELSVTLADGPKVPVSTTIFSARVAQVVYEAGNNVVAGYGWNVINPLTQLSFSPAVFNVPQSGVILPP